MTKNGLYALASLDGRPLAPRDLAVLGLESAPWLAASGCIMAPRDARDAAVQARSDGTRIHVLLGHLDEPDDAAHRLGLAADTDTLTLVLETVRRFSDDPAALLPGSWLLAQWDAPARTMTLHMADQVRDTCHVVTDGARLAVAPELVRLARLDWVEATPDPVNLMIAVGRARLRNTLGERTVLRDVRRVLPGSRVVVRRHDLRVTPSRALAAPAAALPISFEEATAAFDRLLRRVIRQLIEREGDTALALSGGLDSSLLALYMAEERGTHALTFLTAAAPPGSGLADESAVAAITAAHLGIRLEKVAPAADANVYRPADRLFRQHETPLLPLRHYLDEALEQAALEAGARALIDGTGGEATVTSYDDFLPRARSPRNLARLVRDRLRRAAPDGWPGAVFHVRPSATALDHLPDDLPDLWEATQIAPRRLRPEEPLGFETGAQRAGERPGCGIVPGLRNLSPFYDRRLLLYGAGMPAGLVRHRGRDRAPGREMMRGRLPDMVVARGAKLPYSPTYRTMLVGQAKAAHARIPAFRAQGVGAWVDLDWLERMLSTAICTSTLAPGIATELQQTAMFAEYLMWWNDATR